MNIGYVTPEVLPFSKTGGLADVSHALPEALGQQGVKVTVFTPLYRSAAEWLARHPVETIDLSLPQPLVINDESHDIAFRRVSMKHYDVVLVINDAFYQRPTLYTNESGEDYADNIARFSFLSRSVLRYYQHLGIAPDVLHLNDWQTALIAVYLKTTYRQLLFERTSCLLTIHNLGFQGIAPAEEIDTTGLDWSLFHVGALEYYGRINLMKAGIVYADHVNTVSPTYAREIQRDPQLGHGLDGVLREYSAKLSGHLNGIDMREWNPKTDPHLVAHYSAADFKHKQTCKRYLQRTVGLPTRSRSLLLAAIGRFDRQKGFELIFDSFPLIANLDLQLVILGSGDAKLENRARQLQQDFPDQVAAWLGYDEPLAHMIEAGADAYLMPSLYEPCGLNQMYSQRYGTLPIVRSVGGLKDTVNNVTPLRMASRRASGFAFKPVDPRMLAGADNPDAARIQLESKRLASTIRRAAGLYFTQRKQWNSLARQVMDIDHGWTTRSTAYLKLYRALRQKHNNNGGVR